MAIYHKTEPVAKKKQQKPQLLVPPPSPDTPLSPQKSTHNAYPHHTIPQET